MPCFFKDLYLSDFCLWCLFENSHSNEGGCSDCHHTLFIFIIEDIRNVLSFLNMNTNLGNSIYSKYYLKQ